MNAAYIKHEPFGVLFAVTDENYKVLALFSARSLILRTLAALKHRKHQVQKKKLQVYHY